MKCSEFQKVLPEIIDGGGSTEQEAHRKSCPVCADLVADLNAIAEHAKLLVPMVDPPPRVWEGIRRALEQEGMGHPAAGVSGPAPVGSIAARWSAAMRWVAIAALLALAAGLLFYRTGKPPEPTVAINPPAAPATLTTADDQRLLAAVDVRSPAARERYRKNLENVNRAIRDARTSVERDPTDADAQDYLCNAYDQKSLIYDMAMTRTAQ